MIKKEIWIWICFLTIIIFLCFVLINIGFGQHKLFQEIKEFCKKDNVLANGVYVKGFVQYTNGRVQIFLVAYAPQDESICIRGVIDDEIRIICWSPKNGYAEIKNVHYYIFLEEKEAIEIAEKLWKKFKDN